MVETPWKDYKDRITSVRLIEENGSKVVLPSNSGALFSGLSKVTAIDLSGSDTSKVTNMNCMFEGCSSLASLDLSGWDTSKVRDIGMMFYGCSSLTSVVGLSDLKTLAVTNINGMFHGCTSLTSLDLSGWDTSQVVLMGLLFYGCSSLTSVVGLSDLKTPAVTSMDAMFEGCTSLTSLDLSGWDTSKVTSMCSMFDNCPFSSLDLSGWDISKVRDMRWMFAGCTSLASLDLSGWNTSQVVEMYRMFSSCTSLASLDLSGWDTSKVTSMDAMFFRCSKLARVTVGANYAMKDRSMFPAEAAGKQWLSSATGQTYTGDEIVAGRSRVADTYTLVWEGLTSATATLNGTDWSAVYDPAWYVEKNPDVANWARRSDGTIDWNRLLSHFVNSGRKEGRASKQGFELASYYNANVDLRRAFGTDWTRYYDHYRVNGQREGRTAAGVGQLRGAPTTSEGMNWAPVYDANYYAQRNADVANWARRDFASGSVLDDAALLQHFVNSGTKEGRASKATFELASYYNANVDLRRAFGTDWARYYRHYAKSGVRENRACKDVGQLRGAVTSRDGVEWAPVYDANYYAERNADVASWARRGFASGSVLDDVALLSHFVTSGRREGRASKQGFELASYYNANVDLRRAFGTDWARYYDHYRANGQREGRTATGVGQLRGAVTSRDGIEWAPAYDANFYAARNPDVARWATRTFASGSVLDDVALLSHFVNNGAKEARPSKDTFNVHVYRFRYADLDRAYGNDWKSYYLHYVRYGAREGRVGRLDLASTPATFSMGTDHSAAIKSDGSLWMWGWNNASQLGNGTTIGRTWPDKVMDGVAAVSLYGFHSAAIKSDGSLWTWGYNGQGQLGDGTTAGRTSPAKVMDGVATISLGGDYSAAIKSDGSLRTWGLNERGQLGDGTTTDRHSPTRVLDGVMLPTAASS